nr:hypothetical protein CFP56_27497 [Quercus suber]
MQSRTLSREEEAELAPSNKKVKDFNHAGFNGDSRATSPSLGNQDWGSNTKPSFKDKLVGEISGAFAQAFDLTIQMEEDLDSDEESGETSIPVHEGHVKFTLSKETKKCIRGSWSKAVIVKLVGRTVGLTYMQSKLAQLWRPDERMDCINLSNGFFLVRFYSKDDLERIRLNEVPIELYETEVLKELGESIGKVLRIDSYTALEARGRYARLCVQIDINRPLVNSILIGRFKQVVIYEGIQKFCFSYGRVGHKIEACLYTIHKDKDKEPQAWTEEAVGEGNSDLQKLNGVVTHNACEATDVEGHYGPWMLVSRKGHRQKGKRTDNGTGHGIGNAGRSAWISTNQLNPVFAEGTSMALGGPSSSKGLPCKHAIPKFGAGSKYEEKVWASKTPGMFIFKERPTPSPSMARPPRDSFKAVVVSLKHDNSLSPTPRVPLSQPFSVKNKKHLARKLAYGSLPKSAAPLCVEGSKRKITNPSTTHPPLPRAEPNHTTGATFEFSVNTFADTDLIAESESDWKLHTQIVGEKSHAEDLMVSDEAVQIASKAWLTKPVSTLMSKTEY